MKSEPARTIMLRPALLTALASPLLAELLTGTSPPSTFFDPLPAAFRCLLYGSGVLIVHELAIGWRRGWPGILFLGLAFGTVIEGMVSRSLFCTEWLRIGLLGDYGHWLGINWHWSLLILVFHTVYSVGLPILLAELVWPECRERRWLDPAVTQMLLMGFIAAGLYGRQNALPAARHSFWIAAGLVAVGVYLARHCHAPRRPARRVRQPWLLCLSAAGWVWLWLLAETLLPELKLSALLTYLVMLGMTVLASWRWARSAPGWTDRHRLGVVAGLLLPWILLSPGMSADAGRVEDGAGMGLVGLLALVGWVWLWRRVRRSASESAAAGCYNAAGAIDAVGSAGRAVHARQPD